MFVIVIVIVIVIVTVTVTMTVTAIATATHNPKKIGLMRDDRAPPLTCAHVLKCDPNLITNDP